MPPFKDLTGKKFGKLTVLKKATNKKYSRIHWECQCDCGNPQVIIVSGSHLVTGHTKSCGCLQKKAAREVNFIDITNQRFGKLLALKNVGSNKSGNALWECKCNCGNTFIALGTELRNGHIQSCGCLISKGEEKIAKILSKNNILFTTQKTFSTCRFKETQGLAKFDFYVNNKYLIEYDGIQHYKQANINWEDIKKVQERDKYKNEWCKKNNIALIRIPYTHLNELCIEDLLLETTKYRVV